MKDYEYYGYPFCLKEKYHDYENLPLNKETAKTIYFLIYCDTAHFIPERDFLSPANGTKFFYENYTKEELLLWNNEYLNSFIDGIDKEIENIKDRQTFRTFIWDISAILRIYTNDYKTLSRLVDGLCHIVNKLGMFIFDSIIGENFEFPHLRKSLIGHCSWEPLQCYNVTDISAFHNTVYEGLIPTLVLNGYIDLFNKLKENILDKMYMIDEFSERNMKKLGVEIFEYNKKGFKNDRIYIEFLKENLDYDVYNYKDLEKELPSDAIYYGYRDSRREYLDCSNLPLNLDTAKQIYFSTQCNTYYLSNVAGYWYYKLNFSRETLLSWNNDFIRNFVDNFDDKLSQIKDAETFRRFYDELTDVVGVYTSDYNLLSDLINILERCVNEIGSFILYPILNDFYYYGVLINKIAGYAYNLREKIRNIVSIHSFFDTNYYGLLPTLVCNNYIDLYTKLKTNVLDKIETLKCDEIKAKEYKFNTYESLKDDGGYKQYLKYINNIKI